MSFLGKLFGRGKGTDSTGPGSKPSRAVPETGPRIEQPVELTREEVLKRVARMETLAAESGNQDLMRVAQRIRARHAA